MALKQVNQNIVDDIILSIKPGELLEFGDISYMIFKHRQGAVIGTYINNQRNRNDYPWWRVINREGHPVADAVAINKLQGEGHEIKKGHIVGYKPKTPEQLVKLKEKIKALDN